jgi:hypothetical protein
MQTDNNEAEEKRYQGSIFFLKVFSYLAKKKSWKNFILELINKSFNLKQHLKVCNISSFMILILITFFKIFGVRFIIHSRGPHRLLKQKPNKEHWQTNREKHPTTSRRH